MKTIQQILEESVDAAKKRNDDARTTTVKLCELNALTIYQQASERPQRIKQAVDRMVEKLVGEIGE